MKKQILILGLTLLLLMATVTPVSAAQTTGYKKVNTIYIWTDGPMSPQLQLTARLLSFQYKVEVKPYAGNNAARWMYGVTSSPAITVMYSTGSVSESIDSFNLYGSQMNYLYVQYAIWQESRI